MTFAHLGGWNVRKREIQTVLLSLDGDFIVRDRDTDRYAVYDTKLARHPKVPALLQLPARTLGRLASFAGHLLCCSREFSDGAKRGDG